MATYDDDIRRIAKSQKIKGGLGGFQIRDPMPGQLTPFVDVLSPDSKVNATNASGDETVTDGAYDPADPTTYGKLVPTPDWPNGGNNAGDNKNGEQTAEDLLDNKAGPTRSDGSTGNGSASSDGGSLTSITGLEDCDTGQDVTVNLEGRYPVPAGWADADTPPSDPTFHLGVYYNGAGVPVPTARQAATLNLDGQDPNPAVTHTELSFNSFFSFPLGDAYRQIILSEIPFVFSVTNTHDFYPQTCDASSPEVIAACPTLPPLLESEWPTDGGYDISFIDGQFKTNQYDSEAPTTYNENPTSAVNLCTPDGRFVMVRAASDGGKMMYETSSQGGAPTGTMKVYNSDGTMRMAGDATQSNIDSYLPR